MVAVLFLVGQGYEDPEIVDKLLDVQNCPAKPVYEMADERPLVLWDCVFPSDVDVEAANGVGEERERGGGGSVLPLVARALCCCFAFVSFLSMDSVHIISSPA